MFYLKKLAVPVLTTTVLLLLTIQAIRTSPTKQTKKLRFRSDQSVQVNGSDLSANQLNCVPQSSLASSLCSSIIEVTCLEETFEDLCEITETSKEINRTSVSLTISEQEILCAENRTDFDFGKHCYLTFSLDADVKAELLPNELITKGDDDLKDAQEKLRRTKIMMMISVGFLCLLAFVVIGLPALFFCFMWLKFICCTEVADDDEENIQSNDNTS